MTMIDEKNMTKTALPTQTEMNQAFYVDVCRAEDKVKEIATLARALLDTLPRHWHDDALVNLSDVVAQVEASYLIAPPVAALDEEQR